MIRFVVSVPPSLNALLRGRWAKHNWQKRYARELQNYGLVYGVRGQPAVVYVVSIVCKRSRLLDQDNLVGGCKPLVDALKNERLIWDDAPKWIELKVTQERVRRGLELAEVTITPTNIEVYT